MGSKDNQRQWCSGGTLCALAALLHKTFRWELNAKYARLTIVISGTVINFGVLKKVVITNCHITSAFRFTASVAVAAIITTSTTR